MLAATQQRKSSFWVRDLFSLIVFFVLFYAMWIGAYALFTPDEGRYSEIAREMIVTGDYITPRLNGVVFFDKPIFYYWLQVIAMQLFGIKEWALRFWPAFAGVLGCVATYIVGRLLFNRRTGLIASIILSSTPLYYGAAHYANLDLEVAVWISVSLLSFIVGIQTNNKKFLLSAYFFAGLAALTKGLIGIVFPMMIIGSWIVLLNRWIILKKMHLIVGLMLFAVVVLPWYLLVQKINPEFFDFFFVKQQVSRFLTTERFNNRTAGWFYIPVVLVGAFPWSVFLIQSLVSSLKKIWHDRKKHATEFFLMLWVVLIFIFFSIPKSKTVGYILPVFPGLALLIANYLDAYWQESNRALKIAVYAYVVLTVAILIACLLFIFKLFDFNFNMIPYIKICGTIFAVSGCLAWWSRHKLPQFFVVLAATAVAFLLLIAASSSTINQKSVKPLALVLKSELQSTDEVVTYYKYFQDLPIYLEKRITIVADWNASDIALNDNWLREMWYGMPFQDTKDWLINDNVFWERWNSNRRMFVFTDPESFNAISKKSKRAVYKLGEYNRVVLLSNREFPALIKKEFPPNRG